MNRHLQLCDVFLQPSLWDGMPNALLEAMAAGCVCIASDAGGIPEIRFHSGSRSASIVPRWQLHPSGGSDPRMGERGRSPSALAPFAKRREPAWSNISTSIGSEAFKAYFRRQPTDKRYMRLPAISLLLHGHGSSLWSPVQ